MQLFYFPFFPADAGEHMLLTMIRGTYKRSALYVVEAEFITNALQFLKFIRMYKSYYG
jgi:hypothetical protein